MKKKPVWIRISLIAISIIFFIILAIPNAKASENIAMVSMFEPDEGIMIPVIKSMTAPQESVKDFLYYFLLYGYYFYGFPFCLIRFGDIPFSVVEPDQQYSVAHAHFTAGHQCITDDPGATVAGLHA